MKKPRPIITTPSVIVFEEKHGTRYFIANNDADLHRIALKVAQDRLDENWYYEPDKTGIENPGVTREQAENLPPGPIRRAALTALTAYEREMDYYERESERWKLLVDALETNNGAKAWDFLRDRSDGEYENVTIQFAEDA